MANVLFDIATKVVPPDQNIWAIFPGLGRRYYRQFLERSVIFLEMPALNLTRRALDDDETLRRHVAMSEGWQKYYTGAADRPPSRRPNEYEPLTGASFSAAVANVRAVFVRMKPGDLVLTTGHSYYEPILIGEIAGDWDPDVFVHIERYKDERIPARRVRWLGIPTERRFLSQHLSLLLSNRRAVVSIDKAEFGDEVYQIAYGDYVFGEDARYIFKGSTYKNIATATIPGLHLITYFAAAFNACEVGEIEKFSGLNILEAIDNYFEQDTLYSYEIDFHSPGQYVLHARRAALPLLVAVLVSATSGIVSHDDARLAEVTNSATAAPSGAGSPADGCTIEIQEKYRSIMNSINADRFNELCKKNQEAQQGVGLKVDVKTKIPSPPPRRR